MFRCARCQQLSPKGERASRVVMKTREKRYPRRERAMLRKFTTASGVTMKVWVDDPGGEGFEIVREVLWCVECAKASALGEGDER